MLEENVLQMRHKRTTAKNEEMAKSILILSEQVNNLKDGMFDRRAVSPLETIKALQNDLVERYIVINLFKSQSENVNMGTGGYLMLRLKFWFQEFSYLIQLKHIAGDIMEYTKGLGNDFYFDCSGTFVDMHENV